MDAHPTRLERSHHPPVTLTSEESQPVAQTKLEYVASRPMPYLEYHERKHPIQGGRIVKSSTLLQVVSAQP